MSMNTEYIEKPRHHAYVIFGNIPAQLRTSEREGMYVIRSEKTLSVDEVRLLGDYAAQSANGTRRVLIAAPGISFQAQNALLKLFEETRQGVHFYLHLPAGTRLLETLFSRCYVIEETVSDTDAPSEHFNQFITAAPKKRLAMIDEIWDQGESVRHATLLQLVRDFELHAHQRVHGASEMKDEHLSRCLRVIRTAREAMDTGALHKATAQLFAFV